ncbi:MAG: hypothetical protein VCD66_13315, partial [Alphaproteobacteria bacterium]
MNDQNPERGRMSLDDLLQANKAQFDKIFASQMNEAGLLSVDRRPTTAADLESASLTASPATSDARDVTQHLNARYGGGWSSEILEHKAERGGVSVLVKLTVDGISKMQFGSARANGDTGKALQRATDDALAKCAAMLADDPPAAAEAEIAQRRPTLDAPPAAHQAPAGGKLDVVTL